MGAGVSRVVVDVVLLVLAVSLALVAFTPLGSYVLGGVSHSFYNAPSHNLQIVAVTPSEDRGGYRFLVVYVKNVGVTRVPRSGVEGYFDDPSHQWIDQVCRSDFGLDGGCSWPAAVDNSTGFFPSRWLGTYPPICYESVSGPDSDPELLEPGETWAIYYPSLAQGGVERFTVRLFGPGGAQSMHVYWP